jgi:ribosomal protein S18 acetylase RimI-like enzyme
VKATRTYLQMARPEALRPAATDDPDVRIERHDDSPPELWRHLYAEVGRAYHWTDRLGWSDQTIREYLTDPAVSLWILTVAGVIAGYFELRRDDDGGVEIAYFGLLPEFTGRGLGKYLLTVAVQRAWASGAHRVWLHTSSLDHRAALTNYLSRGFTIFKKEEYEVAGA